MIIRQIINKVHIEAVDAKGWYLLLFLIALRTLCFHLTMYITSI